MGQLPDGNETGTNAFLLLKQQLLRRNAVPLLVGQRSDLATAESTGHTYSAVGADVDQMAHATVSISIKADPLGGETQKAPQPPETLTSIAGIGRAHPPHPPSLSPPQAVPSLPVRAVLTTVEAPMVRSANTRNIITG